MIWIAVEDADTHEVTEFEEVTEKQALGLMEGHRVNENDITRFQLQDVEDGRHIIYKGIIYKGGFGFNIWVGRKYVEV